VKAVDANKVAKELPLDFRAGKSTYFIFFLLWSVPSIPLCSVIILRPNLLGELWKALAIVVPFGAIVFFWVSRFRIELSDRWLSYTSLFTGTNKMAINDIQSVEFHMGIKQGEVTFLPPIRLEIVPTPRSLAKKIVINAKVFNRRDTASLLSRLKEMNPRL
jgi:hypothetical protein